MQINGQDFLGQTPLHLAARIGHSAVASEQSTSAKEDHSTKYRDRMGEGSKGGTAVELKGSTVKMLQQV